MEIKNKKIMKQFDYNKYRKNNPLLREFDDEEGSGYSYDYQEGPGASPQEIARTIKQFQSDMSIWNKMAKNDFYSMAQGDSADIKTDYYPEWKRSDFEQVIAALEGGSTSMNEAKNKEKDIEIDIDSAEQITLKGKELDSDKLGTNKKYRDLILKAPDKAFMYKGKPASITAVDLNDGSVDEPKIYLTIINESKINEAFAANSKLANALNFLKRNADNIIEDNPEIASALEAVKASGLTSRDVFTFASLFPRDSFKVDDIRTGKLEAQVNRVYFDGSDMLNKAKALRLFLLAFDNYHYGDKNWYKGY
jgi:hypothetical protein